MFGQLKIHTIRKRRMCQAEGDCALKKSPLSLQDGFMRKAQSQVSGKAEIQPVSGAYADDARIKDSHAIGWSPGWGSAAYLEGTLVSLRRRGKVIGMRVGQKYLWFWP